MKERPILFSAPMVRAILDGRKTQTRRIVKLSNGSPTAGAFWDHAGYEPKPWINGQWSFGYKGSLGLQIGAPIFKCPYGQPGDRLWVKETFREFDQVWSAESMESAVEYRADRQVRANGRVLKEHSAASGHWKPSIFMPRRLSRITIEITKVRVQRLQDISEVDAAAEGVEAWDFGEQMPDGTGSHQWEYKPAYRKLWDAINGAVPWKANPWVWAITFKLSTP